MIPYEVTKTLNLIDEDLIAILRRSLSAERRLLISGMFDNCQKTRHQLVIVDIYSNVIN